MTTFLHRPSPRLLSKAISIPLLTSATARSRFGEGGYGSWPPASGLFAVSPCRRNGASVRKAPAHFFQSRRFCGHVRLHVFPAKRKGPGLVVRLAKVLQIGLDLILIIIALHFGSRLLLGDCQKHGLTCLNRWNWSGLDLELLFLWRGSGTILPAQCSRCMKKIKW